MSIQARNSDEQWHLNNDYNWMTEDQYECYKMLCDLCKGSHHVGGKVKPLGKGIQVNLRYGFYASTYDFNGLTEAVIMAHDRCIRFEISPSGPGLLNLSFFRRAGRQGEIWAKHPTLEEAIKALRK